MGFCPVALHVMFICPAMYTHLVPSHTHAHTHTHTHIHTHTHTHTQRERERNIHRNTHIHTNYYLGDTNGCLGAVKAPMFLSQAPSLCLTGLHMRDLTPCLFTANAQHWQYSHRSTDK